MRDGQAPRMVGHCLACGCDITTVDVYVDNGPVVNVETWQKHEGPVDAACQWFLEALADEAADIMRRHVAQIRANIRNLWGRD